MGALLCSIALSCAFALTLGPLPSGPFSAGCPLGESHFLLSLLAGPNPPTKLKKAGGTEGLPPMPRGPDHEV